MGCIGGNTECGCFNGIVGVLDTSIKGCVGALDTSIKGCVGLIGKPMCGSVGILNTTIKGEIGLAGKPMCGSIGMLDTGIKGRVGIICTPNTEVYLRIGPKVLWFFSQGETHSVDVVSNTRWTVKL